MRGIRLARELLAKGRLPRLGRMTGETERFRPDQLLRAIRRASERDSLKVIINWD
jgi:hypothetical protein